MNRHHRTISVSARTALTPGANCCQLLLKPRDGLHHLSVSRHILGLPLCVVPLTCRILRKLCLQLGRVLRVGAPIGLLLLLLLLPVAVALLRRRTLSARHGATGSVDLISSGRF